MEIYHYFSYIMSYVFFMAFIFMFVTIRFSKKRFLFICSGTVFMLLVLESLKIQIFGGNNIAYVIITIMQITVSQVTILFVSDTRDSKVVFTALSASNYVIAGTVIGTVFYIYTENVLFSLVVSFLIHFLILLFLTIRIRKIYLSFYENKNMENWWKLCLIPVLFYSTFTFIAFFPHSIYEDRSNILGVLFLIITMFVLYAVVFRYVKSEIDRTETENKNALFEQYVKGLEDQCEAVERAEQNLRILRHDIRHYSGIINSLLEEQKYEEIKEITSHVTDITEENKIEKYCENTKINIIISQLMDKAKSFGLTVNRSIVIPQELPVNALKLAAVIGNLFENAIFSVNELTIGEEKKIIDILIRCQDNVLIIEIKNPCEKNIKFHTSTGLPVSEKGKNHGFGLQGAALFADQFNGNFDCFCEDGMFIVRLVAKF